MSKISSEWTLENSHTKKFEIIVQQKVFSSSILPLLTFCWTIISNFLVCEFSYVHSDGILLILPLAIPIFFAYFFQQFVKTRQQTNCNLNMITIKNRKIVKIVKPRIFNTHDPTLHKNGLWHFLRRSSVKLQKNQTFYDSSFFVMFKSCVIYFQVPR